MTCGRDSRKLLGMRSRGRHQEERTWTGEVAEATVAKSLREASLQEASLPIRPGLHPHKAAVTWGGPEEEDPLLISPKCWDSRCVPSGLEGRLSG